MKYYTTSIGLFQKYHNTLCFNVPPKFWILYKHCFQFLLGLTIALREFENDAYVNFLRDNNEYYDVFEKGLLDIAFFGTCDVLQSDRHREFCCNSDWQFFWAQLLRYVEIKDYAAFKGILSVSWINKCKKVAFKLKSDLNWCQSRSLMLKTSNQSRPQNLGKTCLGNRPSAC